MKVIIDVYQYKDSNRYYFEADNRTYIFYESDIEIIKDAVEDNPGPLLTESRARLLIKEIWNFFDGNHATTEDEIVQSLKKGWIKQSKKEEFESYYGCHNNWNHDVNILYQKAQAYIQELEEKVNAV